MSRSLTYYDLGNKKQAMEDANKAISFQPIKLDDDGDEEVSQVSINSYFIRGRIREELGDKGASNDYEPVLRLKFLPLGGGDIYILRENAQSLYNEGCRLKARGAKTEAIKVLKKAASLFKLQNSKFRYQETLKLIASIK